jgi:hypothetical protein
MPEPLVKRTDVYVQRPAYFGVSGCSCGNDDPNWSEFMGHLWCARCEKDFKPEDGGVFDGPIGVNASRMLGLDFRKRNLETGEVFDPLERLG